MPTSNGHVLVTCPPMLLAIDDFIDDFKQAGLTYTAAKVTQTLSEAELISMLPQYDGWIIGDDPATERVVEAGAQGALKAAIKWGVGVDNVDFAGFEKNGVPVENTPGVFGNEVADVALAYVLGLARQTYFIDREIRNHCAWPKPSGISMSGKTVGIVGFGDIGQSTARRLLAFDTKIVAYDPAVKSFPSSDVTHADWPERLGELDFLIFTCPLNTHTEGLFNIEVLPLLKHGVRVINVGRGPVVKDQALIEGLASGVIHSAALDVFEFEPLDNDSPLRQFDQCIFGSHNGSNSIDAVRRVSRLAIERMSHLLSGEA